MSELKSQNVPKRPFLLSIICIAIFVYAGFLALIFLLSIIFNGWVTETLIDYFPEKAIAKVPVFIISLAGLTLNIISVAGAYFLWKLRKKGFYLYLFSNVIFILFPIILGYGNLYSSTILLATFVLIAIFYRKLR